MLLSYWRAHCTTTLKGSEYATELLKGTLYNNTVKGSGYATELLEGTLYNNTVKGSGYATELLKKLCTFYANPKVITVCRKQP